MIKEENFNFMKIMRGIFILMLLFIVSCNLQFKKNIEKEESKNKKSLEISSLKTYKGWWVYGEGQHIFKDEKTLKEYDLEFPHENMQELAALYLAVCEMEYFPMECSITTYEKKDILEQKKILIVADFEILYIQGCGE